MALSKRTIGTANTVALLGWMVVCGLAIWEQTATGREVFVIWPLFEKVTVGLFGAFLALLRTGGTEDPTR
jgi:hypothetical protein